MRLSIIKVKTAYLKIKGIKNEKSEDEITLALVILLQFSVYSVLRATTGSFLAAELAGMIPERQVRPTLSAISTSACHCQRLPPGGRDALRKYACGIFLAKAGSKLCLRPGPKAGAVGD